MPIASYFVLGVSLCWCLAALGKIVVSWRKGSYRFTIWDGGMMFGGKALERGGMLLFGAFLLLLVVADVFLLVAVTPPAAL